jgi:hypothetical protein
MPTFNKKQMEAKKKFFLSDQDREMLAELKVVLEWFEWTTDEFQTNKVSISRVFPCSISVYKLRQQQLNVCFRLPDIFFRTKGVGKDFFSNLVMLKPNENYID